MAPSKLSQMRNGSIGLAVESAQGRRVSPCRARIAEAAEVQPSGQSQKPGGDGDPDLDAWFASINAKVGTPLAEGQAVISVDAKKKELVGDF